ncbi:hypothetical protein ACFL6P_01440 [Candidatus Latescibacterota bacterium]
MSTSEHKRKVTLEFITSDGRKGERSRILDFETIPYRIYDRIYSISPECEENLLPAIDAYHKGEYNLAIGLFRKVVAKYHKLIDELEPHIEICQRVLKKRLNFDDKYYERKYQEDMYKWETMLKIFRFFLDKPEFKIRCKYCGHYIPYVNPWEGYAYMQSNEMGGNNCELCGRGYPAPSFVWDGIDGQAYIYYRHSVTEEEFYREFEKRYEIDEDHTYFLSE